MFTGERYERVQQQTIELRHPGVGASVKEHWAEVALTRLRAGQPGMFSYNVFTVSSGAGEGVAPRRTALDLPPTEAGAPSSKWNPPTKAQSLGWGIAVSAFVGPVMVAIMGAIGAARVGAEPPEAIAVEVTAPAALIGEQP